MKVCKGFLWHGHRFFNLFFKAFPTFYVFFVFVVFLLETQPVMVAEPYIVSQSERENLLGLCAFYPGPWLETL